MTTRERAPGVRPLEVLATQWRIVVIVGALVLTAGCGQSGSAATSTLDVPVEDSCAIYREFAQLVGSFANLQNTPATQQAADEVIAGTTTPIVNAARDLLTRSFLLDPAEPLTPLLRGAIDDFIRQVNAAEADLLSWVGRASSATLGLPGERTRDFVWPDPGFAEAEQLNASARGRC